METIVVSPSARSLAHEIWASHPYLKHRALPGFRDAIRDAAVVWSTIDPGLKGETGRLLRNMTRFATAAWLVYLETTAGGLPLARLHGLAKAIGGDSGGVGQARAMLAYLRYIQYIEPLPREGDARLQRYRTSDKVGPVFRERFRQELDFARLLDPALAELATRIDDHAVFDRYFRLVTETGLVVAQQRPDKVNAIDVFWKRTGGMIVLSLLMRSGEPGDTLPPRGPLTYAVKDFARRAGTSRMQVQSLLNAARKAGHLIRDEHGREQLSDELAEDFELFFSLMTSIYLGSARIALQELAAIAGTKAAS